MTHPAKSFLQRNSPIEAMPLKRSLIAVVQFVAREGGAKHVTVKPNSRIDAAQRVGFHPL
jgi:hypothetical protein